VGVHARPQLIADGVLLDNYEWAEGFAGRFGLYGFDPSTLRRTARPSAHLYARIARNNGLD
jgi:beta-glucosidase